MADDRTGKIRNIESSIHTKLQIRRAKGSVGGAQNGLVALLLNHPAVGIKNCEVYCISAKQGGRGQAILKLIGKVGAGNDRSATTFSITGNPGIGIGHVSTQRSPDKGSTIINIAISIHLKSISPAVEGNVPWVWGGVLPLGVDSS